MNISNDVMNYDVTNAAASFQIPDRRYLEQKIYTNLLLTNLLFFIR